LPTPATSLGINSYEYRCENNANHIRAKNDGLVTAVDTPPHRGRKILVWEVRITDEDERLICVSRCTVAVVPK
jgi:1,4-dihydroxy-2-naphthoyl-CoA hydrolase